MGDNMYYNETVKVPDLTGKINIMKKGKSSYVRYLLETRYVPEKSMQFLNLQSSASYLTSLI